MRTPSPQTRSTNSWQPRSREHANKRLQPQQAPAEGEALQLSGPLFALGQVICAGVVLSLLERGFPPRSRGSVISVCESSPSSSFSSLSRTTPTPFHIFPPSSPFVHCKKEHEESGCWVSQKSGRATVSYSDQWDVVWNVVWNLLVVSTHQDKNFTHRRLVEPNRNDLLFFPLFPVRIKFCVFSVKQINKITGLAL